MVAWAKTIVVAGAAGLIFASCTAPAVAGEVEVFFDFTSYDAAVGGVHDLFLDLETTADGDPIEDFFQNLNSDFFFDIPGGIFSDDVTYTSPDVPIGMVNIAQISEPTVVTEIGPFPEWGGTLQAQYNGGDFYRATGFTCIECDRNTEISLFSGNNLIGTANPGFDVQFQFVGVVSSTPFNRITIDSDLFAIDNHYSTLVPEPATFTLLTLGSLLMVRRRRLDG